MKHQLNISIPNPCSANWDAMQTNSIGKHCSSCNKTVVDFTTMNESEIKDYFVNHTNDKTCGRWKNYQIYTPSKTEKLLLNFKDYVSLNVKFNPIKISLLTLVTALLSFSSCIMGAVSKPDKEDFTTGDSITMSTEIDSIQKANENSINQSKNQQP